MAVISSTSQSIQAWMLTSLSKLRISFHPVEIGSVNYV